MSEIIKSSLVVGLASLLTCSWVLAQPLEPTLYEPFGGVGYEVGEYEALDGYEEGADEALGGNLFVQVASPTDEAIDVVLVGPDGFREVAEVETERLFEGLRPGVYTLMATDDELQPVVGRVEVALGRLAPVTLTMNAIGFVYDTATFEDYAASLEAERDDLSGLYSDYYSVEYNPLEEADAGELVVRVLAVDTNGEALDEAIAPVVSVVGPDDYREDAEVSGVLEALESLRPGAYGVAATAEGYRAASSVAEVRFGDATTVTLTLEPLEEVGM